MITQTRSVADSRPFRAQSPVELTPTEPTSTGTNPTASAVCPEPSAAAEELSSEELSAEICDLSARISLATARVLCLVGEFDDREAWVGHGIASCAHWLAWNCQLSPHTAREHVRVARALRGLPLICQRFVSGELSYAKVRALTRIADSDSELDLAELASAATAAQLERTVAAWRRTETLAAEERANRTYLRTNVDEHGMLDIRARLDTDDGAMLLAALEAMQARSDRGAAAPITPVPTALVDRVPEGAATSMAEVAVSSPQEPVMAARRMSSLDALTALARSYLTNDPTGCTQPTTQLVVNLDAAVLHDQAAAGIAAYSSGLSLTFDDIRRLACDTRLVTVLTDGPDVLDVGRSTRTISPGMRCALIFRDGGCSAPGCHETRLNRVQAHHIHHWADGGQTKLDNLVLLCSAHHFATHHGQLDITAAQGRITFSDPEGVIINQQPKLAPFSKGDPLAPLPATPRATAASPQLGGEPLQLDYVLSVLRQRRNHRLRRRERHLSQDAA